MKGFALVWPSLVGGAAALAAALIVAAGVRALEAAQIEAVAAGRSLGVALAPRLQALVRAEPTLPSILFLGDSTATAYDAGHTVPEALQRRLRTDRAPARTRRARARCAAAGRPQRLRGRARRGRRDRRRARPRAALRRHGRRVYLLAVLTAERS